MTEQAKNDGGLAFPLQPASTPDTHHLGMSLRDWFAGQALGGLLACPAMREGMTSGDYSACSYQIADAMLEARK